MLLEARTTGLTSRLPHSSCRNLVPSLLQSENWFPLEIRLSKPLSHFLKSCKIKCDNGCKTTLKPVKVCMHTKEVGSHTVYEAKTCSMEIMGIRYY